MSGLRLPPGVRRAMLNHAAACAPEECCGLLGGRGDAVVRVIPVENAAHSPTRYRMAPEEQLRGMLALEAQGLELLGIYHSHPEGPAALSPTDLAEARYPECAYLIVAPERGSWGVWGFRLVEDGPAVLRLVEDQGETGDV